MRMSEQDRARLRADLPRRLAYARTVSEFVKTPVKVVLAIGGGLPPGIVIWGHCVAGYVWECQQREGRRFRVLRTYQGGH